MFVEDSESRRFELNIRLGFSEADLGPTRAPELFFYGFPQKFFLFSRIVLITSCTEKIRRVSWKVIPGSF